MEKFIRKFSDTGIEHIGLVGLKNAFQAELFNKLASTGLCIPDGFSITAAAYQYFIDHNGLQEPLDAITGGSDKKIPMNVQEASEGARKLIMRGKFPRNLEMSIILAYKTLFTQKQQEVAVRSSAASEGHTDVVFTGHESYLNIRGEIALIYAVKRCFASLYSEKALQYRMVHNLGHNKIYLAVGIQQMVRSDLGCSGTGITDKRSGDDRNAVYLSGTWGLGGAIVSSRTTPDEFLVLKPLFPGGKGEIVQKKLGDKNSMVVYSDMSTGTSSTFSKITPRDLREKFVLEDVEIEKLAGWAILIEQHYNKVINFEWAKDGNSKELYIVQAKPA